MKRFNIRVYGLILNQFGELLLSDEKRHGKLFTKFPGGGLEWGEGLKEGLLRELQEELGLPAMIGDLFYVNDFFQPSVFHDDDQILAFYFWVNEIDTTRIDTCAKDHKSMEAGESFRWINLKDCTPSHVTFPIDQLVMNKLLKRV